MKNLILALALFLPLASFAGVKEDIKKINDDIQPCVDVNSSTMGMKMCAREAFDKSDKILNDVYGQLITKLNAPSQDQFDKESKVETKRRLVAAQRAWITFRDTNSSLQGVLSLGGTLEGLEILNSQLDMTQTRALELEVLNQNL